MRMGQPAAGPRVRRKARGPSLGVPSLGVPSARAACGRRTLDGRASPREAGEAGKLWASRRPGEEGGVSGADSGARARWHLPS